MLLSKPRNDVLQYTKLVCHNTQRSQELYIPLANVINDNVLFPYMFHDMPQSYVLVMKTGKRNHEPKHLVYVNAAYFVRLI